MSAELERRRLEQWLTYVRWFGVAFAVFGIVTQAAPPFPDTASRTAAWAVAVVLAIGSLVVWGALERVQSESGLARLGASAFALDSVCVAAAVWIFAFEDPYVTWALLFLLPLEGALRYRMRGALGAALGVAVFFVFQTFHFADVHDIPPNFNVYVFVVGMAGLIAGVAGTMAENWHEQSRAFRSQSTKLAELDELKDRYLAVTTHELRGPLTAIITGVDLVTRRPDKIDEDKRNHILGMVTQQARQLARLVDDLMISSQIQAGSLAIEPQPTEIEPVIRQALEAAAARRQQHLLEVYVEPVVCDVDGTRIVQLVRNLVENAYKYTPDTTRVAVTARATDAGLLLEVADNGPGIPPEKRHQLFDAFSRIEETAAGREGVGLGLFVVSQLVTAMNGRIDFASSSRGTTFAIHIPCRTKRLGDRRLEVVREADLG